jgi:hypothetical protein
MWERRVMTRNLLAIIPPPPANGFHIGPLFFHFYGLVIAIGVLLAFWLARKRWQEVKVTPCLLRAPRARNVYPRKVNSVCSQSSRRLPSLQYTILVLAGCSRSPTSAILFAIAVTSILAWRLLTQCTTASSAYAEVRVMPTRSAGGLPGRRFAVL